MISIQIHVGVERTLDLLSMIFGQNNTTPLHLLYAGQYMGFLLALGDHLEAPHDTLNLRGGMFAQQMFLEITP